MRMALCLLIMLRVMAIICLFSSPYVHDVTLSCSCILLISNRFQIIARRAFENKMRRALANNNPDSLLSTNSAVLLSKLKCEI